MQELYICLDSLRKSIGQLNGLTKDALDLMFMQYLRDTGQSLDERPLPSELLNQLTVLLRVLSPSVSYALHAPVNTTGAHISLIGHITKQELLARLDDTSKANGFANRFLWALVKRSKCLPEGGSGPG